MDELVTAEARLRALVAIPASAPGDFRAVGVADLPTRFGDFEVVAFKEAHSSVEHLAIFRGHLQGGSGLLTRLHSECLTGDALGSLRCDCRDQLEAAMTILGQQEQGLMLYLRQEGRGIGLANKIRAYSLQDQGLDTIDANRALNFNDDERSYRVAADMLRLLGVRSIRLMTNNPDKLTQLDKAGVIVDARVPHAMPPNPHNADYLATKARRAGHLLPGSNGQQSVGRPVEFIAPDGDAETDGRDLRR